MNTSKSLDEIIFSQEYPIKNKHLKDCAFVWLDEGNCNCEQNIPKARAAIVEAVEGLYGDSDCWLWAGAKDNDGYGRFQGEVASRYFYKLWVGEIPEGLVVMHKCDTPPCFNPAHLTLGTVAANNADMVAKKRHLYPNRGKYWQEKTHCKHGHEYIAENTLTRKDGRRYCRECDLTRKRKREFASIPTNQVVNPGVNKRGYVGIGIYGSKWESNVGTLWRAARLYGADFIFTIGQRYKRQATDTPDTPKHTPLFEYADWEDFTKHLPRDCEVVLIEQSATSKPLPSFRHPTRAVYVLGAEDHGLPEELLGTYKTVEIPTVEPQSMNVSAAGTLVLYDRHTKVTDLVATDKEARNG